MNLVYDYIVGPALRTASGGAQLAQQKASDATTSAMHTLGIETSAERAARLAREEEERKADEEWWMTYGVLYTALALGGIYLVAKGPELYRQAKARGAFGKSGVRRNALAKQTWIFEDYRGFKAREPGMTRDEARAYAETMADERRVPIYFETSTGHEQSYADPIPQTRRNGKRR